MVHNFSETPSVVNQFLFELRNVDIQSDRMRFRQNLIRFGEMAAFEISKTLEFTETTVETPFGTANVEVPIQNLVVTAVLRAGLPIHEGLTNVFDYASSAFVSTYRKHKSNGDFQVKLEYVTSPSIADQILIIADPMIATGSTAAETIEALLEYGEPKAIHMVTAIAATQGLEYLTRVHPQINIWVGDIDDELTAKSYVVPGLGDAGDLCFGKKQIED